MLGNADAITVIRAGRTVGEVDDPSTVTSRQLAEMMVGSELPSPETREKTVRPEVLLEVRNLTVGGDSSEVSFNQLGKGDAAGQSVVTQASTTSESTVPDTALRALDRVSFEVHAGEIVGIAGVEGNGQTELVEAIMGLRDASGIVLLDGKDLGKHGARSIGASRGIGYVPEDRQRDGMVLTFPLWENVLLGHQGGAAVRQGRVRRPRRGPRPDQARSSPSSTCARRASRSRRSRSRAATSRS